MSNTLFKLQMCGEMFDGYHRRSLLFYKMKYLRRLLEHVALNFKKQELEEYFSGRLIGCDGSTTLQVCTFHTTRLLFIWLLWALRVQKGGHLVLI